MHLKHAFEFQILKKLFPRKEEVEGLVMFYRGNIIKCIGFIVF